MKKLLLIIAGIIALIVFLGSIGPMIALAISGCILYFAFRKFVKSNETSSKVLWGIIGVIALIATVSNLPALIGLVAIVALYYIYKHYKDNKEDHSYTSDDPFSNFEKEWEKLRKNY